MLINYLTPKEEEKLRLLQYEFRTELLNAKDEKEQLRLKIHFSEMMGKFMEQCRLDRFATFKGDPEAILTDVKETAGEIIKQNYEELFAHSSPEELKPLDIITQSNDKYYFKSNFIVDELKDDFQLHIDALQNDPEHLQQLYSLLIEAIEASPYVESGELNINLKQSNFEILRYRRSPLRDITTFGLMNDNASTHLLQDADDIWKDEANGQVTVKWAIPQLPQKQEQVKTYIALTYEGTEGKITRKLTAFDKAVYEALATRFYYWRQDNPEKPLYITPQEIWRTMNGKRAGDGQAKPGKVQVNKICNSLDKMRFTRVYMDISDEIRPFNLQINDERIIGGQIDSYLLNSSKVEFMTDKGNKVEGYQVSEEPIIYTYNSLKDHLLFVPYDLLDTSATTSDSEYVTEFRNYLLQQIQLMKNAVEGKGKFKRNNIILLDTIYESTGILPPDQRAASTSFTSENAKQTYIRKTRKADRDKIEGILDAWKAKGWIKGYKALNSNNEELKERQQAKGYRISI